MWPNSMLVAVGLSGDVVVAMAGDWRVWNSLDQAEEQANKLHSPTPTQRACTALRLGMFIQHYAGVVTYSTVRGL